MTNIATGQGDADEAKKNNILLLSSAEMLASKVATVTRILDCVETMLLSPSEGWSDDADDEDKRRYEGGAVDAAINTYAAGCERLQKLLEADENWTMGEADEQVRETLEKLNGVSIEIQKSRLAQQEFLNRPFMRLRAKLYRRFNLFYAILGEEFNTTDNLFGVGSTPAEAMDNFDAVINSTKQELDEKSDDKQA